MKVAFVSGTSIVNSALFSGWTTKHVETRYGRVSYKARGEHIVLNRHGEHGRTPPHAVNHRANIRAIADLGYVDVIAFYSVGSLKPELPPGALVSCSDYVCLQQAPQTYFDDEARCGAPGIENNFLPVIAQWLAPEIIVQTEKIYVQMQGPRFETRAEIGVIRHWGDVVGMTAAHEADLCRELGLRYNSLAIVDNFANGLMNEQISAERFRECVRANQQTVDRVFARLLENLA